MPLEDDIHSFRLWATNLGCPPDAIPNEEALKSIFKSRQRELFCGLIKRVHPRQVVQEVRENILIKKMESHKDQVVPTCSRSFLPKEMQINLKMQDLKKKKATIETRLLEHRSEYEMLATSIKTKNIQNMSLNHKKQTTQAKVTLLEFKKESLAMDLQKEEKHKEAIFAAMPVRLSAKNANEIVASEAIASALKELESFYNLCNENNTTHNLHEAKEDLWRKMRSIFANIPNFLLFNAIMRQKEDQLQNIMSLKKNSNLENSQTRYLSFSGNATDKKPFTTFELKLMKTKADLLGLVAQYLAARNEHILIEESFIKKYNLFVIGLEKKVNMFNVDCEEKNVDDIISNFLVQYNLRNFYKSQNEFFAEQIKLYKEDIECGAKKLENHDVLLGSIKQIYGEINSSINRIQYGVLQLGQIKEKIHFSKNMMEHQHKGLYGNASTNQSVIASAKFNFVPPKLSVNNISIMGGDSFELSSDNVFCSTKLDFDSTMIGNNSTMRRSFGALSDTTLMPAPSTEGRFCLPPHLAELNVFAETPMELFSCISKECAFYLSPNPLVVQSRELLSSTIQLAPGILLTPFGALQEVRNRIVWAEVVAAHSTDLKLDLELIAVDSHTFKQKIKKQRDYIAEILDKIEVSGVNTNHTLQKVSKLYNFILDNPLRHFIPAEKSFNNLAYADYEAEYIMYLRMANVGTSIK